MAFHKRPVLFSLVCAVILQSVTAKADIVLAQQEVTGIPAITLQFHNFGKIETKYTRMTSEASFGLWLVLDHANNTLYYKIIHNQDSPSMIDVDSIQQKAKAYLEEHEETLKKYLGDIIDFQEVHYYTNLAKDYFEDMPRPTLGMINSKLLEESVNPSFTNFTRSYATIDFNRFINKKSLEIEKEIKIWQKKTGLTPSNVQEVNHAYQTVKNYIDTHPINTKPKYSSDSLSLSLDLDKSPDQDNWGNPSEPHTVQFANIKTSLFRRAMQHKHFPAVGECETSVSVFLYLPPVEEQYNDTVPFDKLVKKIEGFKTHIEKNKRNSIFKENAFDVIKEKADGVVSRVISEIKQQQKKLHKIIDKACETLQNIFTT